MPVFVSEFKRLLVVYWYTWNKAEWIPNWKLYRCLPTYHHAIVCYYRRYQILILDWHPIYWIVRWCAHVSTGMLNDVLLFFVWRHVMNRKLIWCRQTIVVAVEIARIKLRTLLLVLLLPKLKLLVQRMLTVFLSQTQRRLLFQILIFQERGNHDKSNYGETFCIQKSWLWLSNSLCQRFQDDSKIEPP